MFIILHIFFATPTVRSLLLKSCAVVMRNAKLGNHLKAASELCKMAKKKKKKEKKKNGNERKINLRTVRKRRTDFPFGFYIVTFGVSGQKKTPAQGATSIF